MTPERIIASALRFPEILDQLGPALRNDLVLANPLHRRIIKFADDFLREKGKLPQAGDWQLWLSSLPDAQRDGLKEVLGQLQKRKDTEDFDPDFLNETILPELRKVASRTALSRLNLIGDVSPESFRTLLEQIEGVGSEGRGSSPQIRCFDEIAPENVKWIWGKRIPRGMLSEIVGDPDVGKSTLTTAIAAAITRGIPLPGDLQIRRTPQSVLFISAEDSPGATIRPRLEQAGADLSRCHILDGIRDEHGDVFPLNLRAREHRSHLAEVLDRVEAGLVIVDPLAAYLGATDTHRDADVRGVLSPLSRMAQESGAGIVLVRHLNKSAQARKAIHRAGGSIGFTAAVRSSLLVGPFEERSSERAIVSLKHNLSDEPPAIGFTLDGGVFAWLSDHPDVTAADLLQSESSREERTEREEAIEWLRETLREGPLLVKEIESRAKQELGCSWVTIKRAKAKAGVRSDRDGRKREWSWSLDGIGAGDSSPPSPSLPKDYGLLAEFPEIQAESASSAEPEALPLPLGLSAPEPASQGKEETP